MYAFQRLEKRISPRRSAEVPAIITFHQSAMECIIRNVSETGAKIEVSSVGRIPNTLKLVVAGHQPQSCRVVWRSLKEMGVQFLEGDGNHIS